MPLADPDPLRRRLIGGSLALAASGSLTVAGGAAAGTRIAELLTPWKGATPPAPSLVDLQQQPVPLTRYRGKWVLLNLWATWCGPCKEEMPSLERLRAQVEPRGVEVLAISLGDSVNQIESYLAQTPVKLPILIDPGRQMMSKWAVRVLPTSFLLDTQGTVRFSHVGARDWDEPGLVAALQAIAAR